jgi:hypothetical protein
MNRDLPKHMYLQGASYRTKLPNGQRLNLGTDREAALRKFFVLMAGPVPVSVAEPKEILTMWRRHKKGAAQRGLDFSLTPDDISAVLAEQRLLCAVTQLPFKNDKPNGLRFRPWAPSLDRVSNSTGYVAGNVRVVCAFVNIAMNGFGDEFFSAVLEPLVEARLKVELWKLEQGHIPKWEQRAI